MSSYDYDDEEDYGQDYAGTQQSYPSYNYNSSGEEADYTGGELDEYAAWASGQQSSTYLPSSGDVDSWFPEANNNLGLHGSEELPDFSNPGDWEPPSNPRAHEDSESEDDEDDSSYVGNDSDSSSEESSEDASSDDLVSEEKSDEDEISQSYVSKASSRVSKRSVLSRRSARSLSSHFSRYLGIPKKASPIISNFECFAVAISAFLLFVGYYCVLHLLHLKAVDAETSSFFFPAYLVETYRALHTEAHASLALWDHPEPNFVWSSAVGEFWSALSAIPVAPSLLVYMAFRLGYDKRVFRILMIVLL